LKKSTRLAGLALEQLLVKNQVEEIISANQKKTHKEIAADVLKVVDDEATLEKWREKFQWNPEHVEIVYCSVMSTSGGFKLKVGADSTTDNLACSGTIICSVATKYEDYTTILTRTLLINPTSIQERCYNILLSLTDRLIKNLVVGAKLGDIYLLAYKSLDERIRDRFVRSIGFAVGLLEQDTILEIREGCDCPLLPNTTLCLSLGFVATPEHDWALWLTDTVLVREDGAEILTSHVDKSLDNVIYDLQDDEKPPEKPKPAAHRPPNKPAASGPGRPEPEKKRPPAMIRNMDGARRSERNAKVNQEVQVMSKLEGAQVELRDKKGDELKARFKNGYTVATAAKAVDKFDFKPYSTDELPNAPTDLTYFDAARRCVFIPIQGQFVPFHVNVIKNVVTSTRGVNIFFRFNFITPGGGGAVMEDFPETAERRLFIKELTVRCPSKRATNLVSVCKAIKDAQQQLKSRELNQSNKSLGSTVPLQIRSGSRPCLRDINMRPQIGTRAKAAGRLECHTNGFRFVSPRGDTFDILFANIRYAIFQACDAKNSNSVLHFEVKVPITVGRKPWSGIQFLTEVVGIDDLNDRRGLGGYDAGEEAEDKFQATKIEQINAAFRHFVKQTEEAFADAGLDLIFDVPFTSLGFTGNPIRSLVNCFPTRDALVALQEWPSFCVSMSDVEFVVFERYSLQLHEFDLFFVMKNYETSPVKISAVRRVEIDKIKQWLAEMNMVWYHSPTTLNWAKVMKEVIKQIQTNKFFEEGGWSSWFAGDDEDDSSGDEDDNESEYHASETSSEEAYAPSEDNDSESAAPSDDDSESGISWDEMERRTAGKEATKTGSAPAPPPPKRRKKK